MYGTRVLRLIHDESVPDSGYASAEEELEEDPDEAADPQGPESAEGSDALRRSKLSVLIRFRAHVRHKVAHRIYRTWRYLALVFFKFPRGRGRTIWITRPSLSSLLSAFAGDDKTEEALTRCFSIPLPEAVGLGEIKVELNDAPLSSEDHTSVGPQSWASSIVLAERICARPMEFGLSRPGEGSLRILELGAGTGLLKVVVAGSSSIVGLGT